MDTDEGRAVETNHSIEESSSSSTTTTTTTASSSSSSSLEAAGVSIAGSDGDSSDSDGDSSGGIEIGDLVEFYKAAKKCFDEDEGFQEASRLEVVQLQSGG